MKTKSNLAEVVNLNDHLKMINGTKPNKTIKLRKDGQPKQSGGRHNTDSCYVRPIKDKQELANFFEYFEWRVDEESGYLGFQAARDLLLITIGMNTAYRISDLVNLKWNRIFEKDGSFVSSKYVKEQKTQKYREFYMNDRVKSAISRYLSNENVKYFLELKTGKPTVELDQYVFWSSTPDKPISTQTALNMMNKAADWIGLKYNVGTHTMRKTFGYHVWTNSGKDATILHKLMSCFNHSSQQLTLGYLDITNEEVNELYDVVQDVYADVYESIGV